MRAEGHSCCFSYNIFAGGWRGCRGAPSTEALPCNPGKRTSIACAWAPLWAAGVALTSVHFSSHFVLRHSFVSDIARAETFPLTDHLILFYMPFLMSGMFGTRPFIPFSFIIIILLILLSLAWLLPFAESISVHQRESRDSRAAAFRHGAVVTLRGRPVMNRICSDSCSADQFSRSPSL